MTQRQHTTAWEGGNWSSWFAACSLTARSARGCGALRAYEEFVYFRKGLTDGRYALTDRNFSVIGLMEDDPTDADDERIRYTPYGEATATLRSDVDFDGDVDGTDRSLVNGAIGNSIGAAGYKVEYDVNRDGTIDATDRTLVSNDIGSSIAAGQVSGQGNLVGYDGYIFEPGTGTYCVRHRWYLPETGRWLGRDPLDYVDGANEYQMVRGNPVANADPFGLQSGGGPERVRPTWIPAGTTIEELRDMEKKAKGKVKEEIKTYRKALEQKERIANKNNRRGGRGGRRGHVTRGGLAGLVILAGSVAIMLDEAAEALSCENNPCRRYFKEVQAAVDAGECNDKQLLRWKEHCMDEVLNRLGAAAWKEFKDYAESIESECFKIKQLKEKREREKREKEENKQKE